MELGAITMEKEKAEAAFREYREAVRSPATEKLSEAKKDYAEIDRAVMQGYKWLAKGHQLVNLTDAMRLAGEMQVELRKGWSSEKIVRRAPALAVCRADARTCLTTGINRRGGVVFHANDRWSTARKNVVTVLDNTFDEQEGPTEWMGAMVPTVPPPFRPAHSLSGYHILWEAEWEQGAPVDPALLKHLGGDLYAVLAVWDLTELERSVLAGVRAE